MNGAGSLAALKAFARRPAGDRCGLCAAAIAPAHAHLLDVRRNLLECACPGCALLFERKEGGPWRLVPPLSEPLAGVTIDDARWESWGIPIGLAYFVFSTAAGRVVAYYPSPAGAVESKLPLETWQALVADNPALSQLEPDVEALLVNRMGGARDYYRVSVDECFALVGLVRSTWRGFTGGAELREGLREFLGRLGKGGARA